MAMRLLAEHADGRVSGIDACRSTAASCGFPRELGRVFPHSPSAMMAPCVE